MRKQALVLLSLFALAACQRPQDEGSRVSIQIPSAKQFSKMQNVSALAVDYNLLCFGVNVKGPGITGSSATSCDIERGIFSGATASPGQKIELDVPSGDRRVFEVYAFLRDNVSQSCPVVTEGTWGGWSTSKIYAVGKSDPVTITPPASTVSISLNLPEASQNLAALHGWANNSCYGAPTITATFAGQIAVGAGDLVSGSTMKMRARVSHKNTDQVLVGPSIKFKGGVSGF